MNTIHYLALAVLCLLVAVIITLDAMLNTQRAWHTVGFVTAACGIALFSALAIWGT